MFFLFPCAPLVRVRIGAEFQFFDFGVHLFFAEQEGADEQLNEVAFVFNGAVGTALCLPGHENKASEALQTWQGGFAAV